jgi:hypothetical protein
VDPLDLEEYRQLRATIRERGSLRVTLFVTALVAWAVLASLIAAFISLPLASLLPLVVLVGGFEAVHALHVGAERIGRYLFVNYESAAPRLHWEGAIAAFGHGHRPTPRPADSLFSFMFASAVFVNFLAAALAATPPELAAIGALHGLALARIFMARRAAAGQRAEDQKRFEDVLR